MFSGGSEVAGCRGPDVADGRWRRHNPVGPLLMDGAEVVELDCTDGIVNVEALLLSRDGCN